jgi:hypothetical protein
MFRGTKGAMRLHRAGYEVYNEIPNYSEAFQPPRELGISPISPCEEAGCGPRTCRFRISG